MAMKTWITTIFEKSMENLGSSATFFFFFLEYDKSGYRQIVGTRYQLEEGFFGPGHLVHYRKYETWVYRYVSIKHQYG